MPKLTGEELSKLYPQAKTYDELRVEHEAIQETRRPKFVAEKIALSTSLMLPTVLITLQIVQRVASSLLTDGTSMTVLTGVCFSIIALVIGLSILYYLYTIIDGIASIVFPATTPLYFALLCLLCIAAGLSTALPYPPLLLATSFTTLTFVLSFIVASIFKRYV